jgi:hypothetical protein
VHFLHQIPHFWLSIQSDLVRLPKVVKLAKVVKLRKVVKLPKVVQLENLRLPNAPLLVHFCSKITDFGAFLHQMWESYQKW